MTAQSQFLTRTDTLATTQIVAHAAVADLRAAVRGIVIAPGETEYDVARAAWNSIVDRRPLAIVRAAGVADVQAALAIAKASGLPFAVKNGGHSVDGLGLADGGIVVDLSPFGAVQVDPARRVARVDGGVIGKQFGAALAGHGLVAVGGKIPTTGVTGVTLGGGIGWLARKHGLVADNLLAAELVLADGSHVRTDATERPDLFWALRGGGGNFGVVTALEFRVHALPQVYAGLLMFPFERGVEVLRAFREFAEAAPNEVGILGGLMPSPVGPPVSGVAFTYAGDPNEGEAVMAPLVKALGEPVMAQVGAMPYGVFVGGFEAMAPAGLRHAMRARYSHGLGDGAIEALVDGYRRQPEGGHGVFLIERMGGAIAAPASPTAFSHRAAAYDVLVEGVWADPALDAAQFTWVDGVIAEPALAAEYTGGTYVNYLQGGEEAAIRAAYGASYERLTAVKAVYDPDNVFRGNKNVAPAR